MIDYIGNLLTTPAVWVLVAVAAFVTWNRYDHAKKNAIYNIVLNGTCDISEISSTLQMDYKGVEKRLNKLIALANSPKETENSKWNLLNNAYIDYQRKRVVLSSSSSDFDNAQLVQSTGNGGLMETIICNGCGSQNTVSQGGTAKCEYCGVTLVSDKTLNSPAVTEALSAVASSVAQPINVHVTVNNVPSADGAAQINAPYQNGVQQVNMPSNVISNKKRSVALLLCLFLGIFGGHLFYAGRAGKGILYIFTIGLFVFGAAIDFLKILFGSFKDKTGNYIKNW